MACEMCGKETDTLPALIEGVVLNVCEKCSSFGRIVKKPRPIPEMAIKKKPSPVEEGTYEAVREDFPGIIRAKRESLGLKQEEFAKRIAEKESVIHKMESGTFTPSIAMAKKIERLLGISIVEEKKIEHVSTKSKPESFTIGDVLKVK